MKIAIASSGLGHVARGNEAWAADLGRALAERGQDVLLCKGAGTATESYERVLPCWQREEERTKRLFARISQAPGGWRTGLGSVYGIEQTSFTWKLIRFLRREQIDLLHVQDPLIALRVQQAWRLGWVPTRVVLAHGTEESLHFQKRIIYLQHLAPYHQDAARLAGAWRPTWTAIPNFIDTDTYQPGESGALRHELGIPDNALVVVTAAAIQRHHKRIDYLIDEFAHLIAERPDLPAYLIVAGGREADTEELVEYGRVLLGDRVRFLVRFPRERMPELYRAANLFVLCSLKEMFGIVLLEAAATGLPCIVHRDPIFEWVVGEGGKVIDMAAPGALSSALVVLLTDNRCRQTLGERARSHCIENFSSERVVDQILEYYTRTVLGTDSNLPSRQFDTASNSSTSILGH